MRRGGASPGVELYCLDLIESRGRGALALPIFVGAGARTGSGLAHSAAAVHAVIRCGRGEAACAEPGRGALVLGFCLRVDGVRAVFFVTLGTVSCSDYTFPEPLGLRTRASDFVWPLQSVFVATVYAARGPYTRLKIGAGSRRCKPEVETNQW